MDALIFKNIINKLIFYIYFSINVIKILYIYYKDIMSQFETGKF